MENDAKIGRRIKAKLTKQKFMSTPLGRRFLGIAMMYVPKLALESAEKIIALFICWFLANIELDCFFKEVAVITPSATALKDIMTEEAVDTITLKREEMEELPLGLMCDKGEGDKEEMVQAL